MGKRALRIGLSARLMHAPPVELGFKDKVLQYLEQSVAHWIMYHGALVFMIPTLSSSAGLARSSIRIHDVVEALDGLVLQGGADISPQSYGEEPLQPQWAGDRLRDRYEIELFWEFVIQNKPVLGVCRGAQLINVALGGTLHQDIETQCPGASRHIDPALYDENCHEIDFVPESRLALLYEGTATRRVTSIHHQAINKLGNDVTVEARSPADGIIEAIRMTGAAYVAGIQWHPEFHSVDPDLLDSTPVMRDFLDAADRR
jgi:putative glutamine amidotransferase